MCVWTLNQLSPKKETWQENVESVGLTLKKKSFFFTMKVLARLSEDPKIEGENTKISSKLHKKM